MLTLSWSGPRPLISARQSFAAACDLLRWAALIASVAGKATSPLRWRRGKKNNYGSESSSVWIQARIQSRLAFELDSQARLRRLAARRPQAQKRVEGQVRGRGRFAHRRGARG